MFRKLLAIALLSALAHPALAASCKLTEYRALGKDSRGELIGIGLEPPVTTQTVTYTTATASSAFSTATTFIRVVCDAKAHFRVTTAGTAATASDPYVPANVPEYFAVSQAAGTAGAVTTYRISFYDGSS